MNVLPNDDVLGVNTIMAQFDITPYHWPGWMLSVMAVIIGIITLTMFTETRSFPKLKNVCPSLRLSFELRTIGSSRKIAVSYISICHFLNNLVALNSYIYSSKVFDSLTMLYTKGICVPIILRTIEFDDLQLFLESLSTNCE